MNQVIPRAWGFSCFMHEMWPNGAHLPPYDELFHPPQGTNPLAFEGHPDRLLNDHWDIVAPIFKMKRT